jgi:uncharacterized protein (DUF1800 family)/uncharacterized protein (DUF1501 family)
MWYNPPIHFSNLTNDMAAYTHVYSDDEVTLTPIVATGGEAVVLSGMNQARADSCDITKKIGHYSFMSVGGMYYRFDPREKKLANTVDDPYRMSDSISAFQADNEASCPAGPSNFLNEGGCIRAKSCSPAIFSDTAITLSESALLDWYRLDGKAVHYLLGVRLEDAYEVSPCSSGTARWQRIDAGCTPTALDVTTAATLEARIRGGVDTENPYVMDVTTVDYATNCSTTQAHGVSTIGAILDVDGACFRHVHPQLFDVHDFSLFSLAHPGNDVEYRLGRPNPLTRFSEEGMAALTYPHSSMDNLETSFGKIDLLKGNTPIGRLGDVVSFRDLPASLQTLQMAATVGASSAPDSSINFEACGSPNEVADIPELGSSYVSNEHGKDGTASQNSYKEQDRRHSIRKDKYGVFTSVSFYAQDQLRQRMGFALSEIFNVGETGFGGHGKRYVDVWAYYQDIMLRHAFGNYRELMKEVAFSPIMAEFLTFLNSKSLFKSKSYPDENFARELMQLFTIGRWELDAKGMPLHDENGSRIPTYSTVDITNFARAWTGFEQAPYRDDEDAIDTTSDMDPMVLNPESRDDYPKTKLKLSGYIGDDFPLCTDLPAQHYLAMGAKFVLTGSTSMENIEDPELRSPQNDDDAREAIDFLGRFAPSPTSSGLYSVLCARTGGVGTPCTFPKEVVLEANIVCDGRQECGADTIEVVQMVDPADGNNTVYYTYSKVPCVRLGLFQSGVQTKHPGHSRQCTNIEQYAAGPLCCNGNGVVKSTIADVRKNMCLYFNEMVTYTTAVQRCAAQGYVMCPEVYTWDQIRVGCSMDMALWLKTPDMACTLRVQVSSLGLVSIIDHRDNTNANQDNKRYLLGNMQYVSVLWKDEQGATTGTRYPTAASNNCQLSDSSALSCEVTENNECLCQLTVEVTPVFSDTSMLPSLRAIENSLFIGAPLPASFASGMYSQCVSDVCTNDEGIVVYVTDVAVGQLWNTSTIIELPPRFPGGNTRRFFNKQSLVYVGEKQAGESALESNYVFRNAPNFMPTVGENPNNHKFNNYRIYHDEVALETEAVLDYLFEHNNTPSFVGRKLIQRFVTSNPSPRYVKAVADAFRSGTYAGSTGTFSGKRGDLAATLAAILLDQEARSPVLALDPGSGKMREPLLKVLHLMRALEFEAGVETTEIHMPDLQTKIGQGPFQAPSVFGFFDEEYSPKGGFSKRRLYAPEAQLSNGPFIVNYLNGMMSLIDQGLTHCSAGFGDRLSSEPFDNTQFNQPVCDWSHLKRRVNGHDRRNTGRLTFESTNSTATPMEVVEELDLLLTGGRLSEANKHIIADRYAVAAGLADAPLNEDGEEMEKEFNCMCYLERYPEVAATWAYDEGGVAAYGLMWQTRHNCKRLEQWYWQAGKRKGHDPSCANKDHALREATKLFLFTPEFSVTNLNRDTGKMRKAKVPKVSSGRDYKAVVVIMLEGGADTFNMLAPHSNCASGDLYAEYAAARGGTNPEDGGGALAQNTFHTITSAADTQPCDTYGVHHKLPVLQDMYNEGDLSFLANVGQLIEPITIDDWLNKRKRVPLSLGDHRGGQNDAQSVHPQNSAAEGVMGRIMKVLVTIKNAFKGDVYSVWGNMKAVEGSKDAPYILDRFSKTSGVPRFLQYGLLQADITNITMQGSYSYFAETVQDSMNGAIEQTEKLGSLMSDTTLSTTFPNDREIGAEMTQVAKVIKLHSQLDSERDLFVTTVRGFDVHGTFDEVTAVCYERLNNALEALRTELQAQGTWNKTTILTISDFGRTITSNGRGTDHGWGGNYFLAGGAVKGGKILGKYPAKLGPEGPGQIGRGRIIPTHPWEAVWLGISEWLGVPLGKMARVLPNVGNFPDADLWRKDDLFTAEH